MRGKRPRVHETEGGWGGGGGGGVCGAADIKGIWGRKGKKRRGALKEQKTARISD